MFVLTNIDGVSDILKFIRLMSNRSAWRFESVPFQPQILERIQHFNAKELKDENRKCIWIDFAEKFSKMALTPQIVEKMDFDTFETLKLIMSQTLTQLSQETESRTQEIRQKEQQYTNLVREEKRLQRISQENRRKEKQIENKKNKLMKESEKLSQFGESDESFTNSNSRT